MKLVLLRKRARESSSSDCGPRSRAASSDSDVAQGQAQSSDDEGGTAKVASKLGLEVSFFMLIITIVISSDRATFTLILALINLEYSLIYSNTYISKLCCYRFVTCI